MKANEKLQNIAEAEGLRLIETTSERNGYPNALRYAVIGFNDFAHAERLAEKYGCRIEDFRRKLGWDFWYRTGERAWEALETHAEDFGANARSFFAQEAETLYEDEVKHLFYDVNTLEEAASIIDEFTKLRDALQMIDEDEVLIYFGNGNWEVRPIRTMEYSYDNEQAAIGIICDDEEEAEYGE